MHVPAPVHIVGGARVPRHTTAPPPMVGSHPIKGRFLNSACASFLEAFARSGGRLTVSRSGFGTHKTIKSPGAVRGFRACFPERGSRFTGRATFQQNRAESLVDGNVPVGRLHVGKLVLKVDRGLGKLSPFRHVAACDRRFCAHNLLRKLKNVASGYVGFLEHAEIGR